jgi:MFS family permease
VAEARARGLDPEDAGDHPWRRVLRPDVIVPAFGCAVLLLVYYTAVVFFPSYFATVRGFSLASANSLGVWLWAFAGAALLLAGIASDATGVRKPFMVAGAVGAIASTVVLADLGRATPYGMYALMVSLLAVCLGVAFGPWMAAFTETVERRNPELTGTGLAVWSWIVWAAVVIFLLIVPVVVPSLASVTDGQRRDWLWACATGQVVFLPTVWLLSGRWNPRKARRDAEAHELRVQAELQSLGADS